GRIGAALCDLDQVDYPAQGDVDGHQAQPASVAVVHRNAARDAGTQARRRAVWKDEIGDDRSVGAPLKLIAKNRGSAEHLSKLFPNVVGLRPEYVEPLGRHANTRWRLPEDRTAVGKPVGKGGQRRHGAPSCWLSRRPPSPVSVLTNAGMPT